MCEIQEPKYENSVTDYKEKWRTLDEVLYTLCRDHPGHDRFDGICAKLSIIGRTYSTGIERQIKSDNTQGSSMLQLANYFFEHRAEIDSIISDASALMEPLTKEGIVAILIAHGKLVRLLTGITKNGYRPRSFVSKYLHFHNPVFPIYDSVASRKIRQIVQFEDVRAIDFKVDGTSDSEYNDYVRRFYALYQHSMDRGLPITVRSLDYYLIS
jgi:hypothetical protein